LSVPFPPNRRVPAAAALAAAQLPSRVRDTLEAVYALAYEVVVDRLDRLIPQIEARLGHLRDRGAHHAVGVSYLEQSQLLARRQGEFIAKFAQAIDGELASLRDLAHLPQRAAETPTMPTFDELRLVDEDEADEVAEAKSIALRLESRASLPIQLMCQRFAVLAEAPAFEPGRLPVGPQRLCELMLAAAEATGFSLALRIALLREFDRGVLSEYPGIAESFNDLLARMRVMPGLSFVPLRSRGRSAATGSAAEAVLPDGERPHTGWTSSAPSDGDSTFQMLQELLASRRSMADRFRGPGFAPGAGGEVGRSGGSPLQRATARPELPTTLALELLRDAGDDVRGLEIDAVRQWLLLQGRHRMGEAVSLSQADADVFELLGLMYTHLQREVRPDSPAIAMLDAIRLPLLRLALTDATFFLRPSHPGREILNAVAESGARWYGPDDVDPQLLLHLQRIVDGIARARDDVGAAFRAGLSTLEAQQQAVARRADIAERRNIEAARGKDKLAVARHVAAGVIDDALATTRVPAFHRGMLRHAWADVLTLAHLRNGEGSAEWATLVDATGQLVRAAAGSATAGPDLVLLVDHWLVTVGYHADDAGRIARILTGTVDDESDEAATRTELAMRLKARARLGEDASGEGASAAPLDAEGEAQAQRVRALPPGAWIEIREGSETLRRRLSWFSPATGNVLFVNARGQRVADGTVNGLAQALATGRARIITAGEGRPVYRAWRAALASLAAGPRMAGAR
jgi:hypothetical protein